MRGQDVCIWAKAHTDSSPGRRLPPYLYITRRKTQGIPISRGGIPSYSILISNY